MLARCSKCDFWNLGEIPHRNRYPDFFHRKFFSSKKIQNHFGRKKKLVEKYFLDRFYVVGTGPDQPPRRKSSKNHGNPSQIIKNDVFFTNFVWTVLHHYLELGAGIWTGAKRDSEFSFSEKKLVEKNSVDNKFWLKKKTIEKKFGREFFGRQKFWSAKFLVEFFFRSKKIDPKNIFQPTFFFDQNGFEFFSTKKTFDEKNLVTYSDGEFPQDSKNHT